jgi:TonB family protein
LQGKKGLAIASLALGVVGLFSAGGLVVGSLLGLGLAAAALSRPSTGGRDVAWAGLAANLFALLTVVPIAAAVLAYRSSPFPLFDDPLPEPAQNFEQAFVEAPPPPPPPPPPRPSTSPTTRAATADRRSIPQSEARPPAEEPLQPVRIGGSIREPRKLRHVNPAYPPDAIQARVQGVVVLECTIDAAGKVTTVRALRGAPLLTEAAVAAVKQWEYTPTVLNGVPVPVVMTVTVNFKLS